MPVERSDDAGIRPTLALSHLWRNFAGLTWQPLGMLTMDADLASTRDRRDDSDSTPLGRLACLARSFLFGIPVPAWSGIARSRIRCSLDAPALSTWLAAAATS